GVSIRAWAKYAELGDSHRRGIRVWIGRAGAVTLPVPPHCFIATPNLEEFQSHLIAIGQISGQGTSGQRVPAQIKIKAKANLQQNIKT
ncbi:hypothetical protein KI387_038064, partial [Taxus chinensis]